MSKPSSPAQATVNTPVSAREARERADLAHWLSISTRATDPSTAQLILDFLDQHTSLREQHIGVYLVAKDTVQRERIRHAKAMRRGQAVAAAVRAFSKACTSVASAVSSLCASTGTTLSGLTARNAATATGSTAAQAVTPAQPPAPSKSSVAATPVAPVKPTTRPAGIRAPAHRPTLHSRAVQPRPLSPHQIVPAAASHANALTFPTIIDPFAN